MNYSANRVQSSREKIPLAQTGLENGVLIYDPAFDRDFTERLLGRRAGNVSRATTARIHRLWKKSASLIQPRLTYAVMDIDQVENNRLVLENGVAFTSRKMAFSFRHARQAVIFLATVGEEIDRSIDRLMHDQRLANSTVVDAIGSGAVESLADRFQHDLARQFLPLGQVVGLRFSPGYCDWSVHEQHQVFSCLDAGAIDVDLSDSSLMSPRKSISGVFGIFEQANGPESQPQNPCLLCAKKDCIARRARQPATIH